MHSSPLPATKNFENGSLAAELLERYPVLGDKIATALNCPPEETRRALSEVLRFLFLSCEHGRPLPPSLVVDLAWHEWILFTEPTRNSAKRSSDVTCITRRVVAAKRMSTATNVHSNCTSHDSALPTPPIGRQ